MNNLETLLHRDKEAGVPEPADPAFTAAIVRRRLADSEPDARAGASRWAPIALAACAAAGVAVTAVRLGLDARWLLPLPLAAAAALPILLRKGV